MSHMAGPKAPSKDTDARWNENRRRRRMLDGHWTRDLEQRLAAFFTRQRRSILGKPDTAKNLARSIVGQLSTLYNRPATPMHEQEGATEAMRQILADAGHWQIMQGGMPLIIGQREGLVMCDAVQNPVSRRVELLTRFVPADLVHVESHADTPDSPVRVYEYRVRRNADGDAVWTRDAWDISNPEAPFFEIQDDEGVGWPGSRIEGDAYKANWSYSDGEPFIPGEWFHAQRTGKLADPMKGRELFDGALTVAALWTFWGHIIRDCSWPQRYTSNARPAGAVSHEGEGTPHVDMDPSAILCLEPVEPGVAVIISQFEAGGDPMIIGQAIRDYGADLASDFDISPQDIMRAQGDARSGFAIELTKDGQRNAQATYEPSFSRHDSALLGKIAAMMTRAGAASLPDRGWSVEYSGIPLGLSERKAQLEELEKLVEMELISKVQALARHEGIPMSEARERLMQAEADIRRFA